MSDLISRQAAIDALKEYFSDEDRTDTEYGAYWHHKHVLDVLRKLPTAQPEPCEDKLKEIAEALSEKMCYMNTCLNERDIILGYLGVKRPSETHCNSDCRNEKCESYHYATKKLPSAQPEIVRCKDCEYYKSYTLYGQTQGFCNRLGLQATEIDDFCSRAERR